MTLRGGEGGGQKVNVIVTLRSAKVVWKCPLMHYTVCNKESYGFVSSITGCRIVTMEFK